tara:strand:+ start:2077 stop:2493 length:417 start_codon:yes stop_codon:yes gene_type:complete
VVIWWLFGSSLLVFTYFYPYIHRGLYAHILREISLIIIIIPMESNNILKRFDHWFYTCVCIDMVMSEKTEIKLNRAQQDRINRLNHCISMSADHKTIASYEDAVEYWLGMVQGISKAKIDDDYIPCLRKFNKEFYQSR